MRSESHESMQLQNYGAETLQQGMILSKKWQQLEQFIDIVHLYMLCIYVYYQWNYLCLESALHFAESKN